MVAHRYILDLCRYGGRNLVCSCRPVGVRMMSRLAIAAILIVVGWCASVGPAHADPAPPPPPTPKTTIDGDGTFAVGTDIAPGVYQSAGPVENGACYWKRTNGDELIDNAMTKKPQVVQIDPTDTAFTTNECQQWQKTDAAPPPQAAPGDLLGQLGAFIGKGILAGGG
jgi:hypothetical protein